MSSKCSNQLSYEPRKLGHSSEALEPSVKHTLAATKPPGTPTAIAYLSGARVGMRTNECPRRATGPSVGVHNPAGTLGSRGERGVRSSDGSAKRCRTL